MNKKFIFVLILILSAFCLGGMLENISYASEGYNSLIANYNGNRFSASISNSGTNASTICIYDGNTPISLAQALDILINEEESNLDPSDYNKIKNGMQTYGSNPRAYYVQISYNGGQPLYSSTDDATIPLNTNLSNRITSLNYPNDTQLSGYALDGNFYEDINQIGTLEAANIGAFLVDHEGYSPVFGNLYNFLNYVQSNSSPTLELYFGIVCGDSFGIFQTMGIRIPLQYTVEDPFLAVTGVKAEDAQQAVDDGSELLEQETFFEKLEHAISSMIRGLANFTYNIIMSGVQAAGASSNLITIDDLVFDTFPDTSLYGFYNGSSNSLISKFKSGITTWYDNFQGMAFLIYLILLLYVGLRILLATGGKQQSKYKDMLLGWLQGLVLLVLFPYAIRYCIELNHAIVGMISDSKMEALQVAGTSYSPMMPDPNFSYPDESTLTTSGDAYAQTIVSNPFKGHDNESYMAFMACTAERSKKIIDAIVYFIMIIQFIMLLMAYYKRVFMFAFLLTIFPIVMIMYPIDKAGDGHAQSFGTWSTEIMMNIFMQIFHAIVYVFVIGVVYSSTSMEGTWLLAIVGISFLFKGEELLRSILGPGETQTAPTIRETAGKTIAAVAVLNTVTNKFTDNFGHMTAAIRYGRRARTERHYANFLNNNSSSSGGGATGSSGGSAPGGSLSISTSSHYLGGITPSGYTNPDIDRELVGTGVNAATLQDSINVIKNIKDTKDPKAIADALKNLQIAAQKGGSATDKMLKKNGLTASQLNELTKIQSQAMEDALKGDKSQAGYSKTLETLNKNLEITIKAQFPNMSDRDIKMIKHGMLTNMADRSMTGLFVTGADGTVRTFGDPSAAVIQKTYLNAGKMDKSDVDASGKPQNGIVGEARRKKAQADGYINIGKVTQDAKDGKMDMFAKTSKPVELSAYAKRVRDLMVSEMSETVYENSAGQSITKKEAKQLQKAGGTVTTRKGIYYDKAKDYSDKQKEAFATKFAMTKEYSINSQSDAPETIIRRELNAKSSGTGRVSSAGVSYRKTNYTLEQMDESMTFMADISENDELKGFAEIFEQETGVTGKEAQMLFDETVGVYMTKTPTGRDREYRKMVRARTEAKPTDENYLDSVEDAAEIMFDESEFEKGMGGLTNSEKRSATSSAKKAYKKIIKRTFEREQKFRSSAPVPPPTAASGGSTGGPTGSGSGSTGGSTGGAPGGTGAPGGSTGGASGGTGAPGGSTGGAPGGTGTTGSSSGSFVYDVDSLGETTLEQLLYNESEGVATDEYAAKMAQERRNTIATVFEDVSQGAMYEDQIYINNLQDVVDYRNADEHMKKAEEYRHRAYEEAIRAHVTLTGSLLGASVATPLAIGIGSGNIIEEGLAGASAGIIAGDSIAERITGPQKKVKTIQVRNPYDGTITEVDLQRTGFSFDPTVVAENGGLSLLDENKVYDLSEIAPLMTKSTRLKVQDQLVDAAQTKRKEIEEQEAATRVNLYQNTLFSSKKDKRK